MGIFVLQGHKLNNDLLRVYLDSVRIAESVFVIMDGFERAR